MARTPEQNNAIITGSIPRQLLLFFFPIWLGTLFQQLYNTVDTLIVGNFVGTEALAAVGATGSFVQLLVGIFVGLCSGAGVIVAQSFGAGKYEEVDRQVHTALALAITGGIVLTAAGLLISRPVLRLMQTPDDIVNMATEYLQIYFLGMVPQMVYNMGTNILRAVGDSKRPLYFLIVASLVNIVLDVVLVAVIPLGVAGAAIATVASQVVSAVHPWLAGHAVAPAAEKHPHGTQRPDGCIPHRPAGCGAKRAVQRQQYDHSERRKRVWHGGSGSVERVRKNRFPVLDDRKLLWHCHYYVCRAKLWCAPI